MYQIQLYTINGEVSGYEAYLSLDCAVSRARVILGEAKKLPLDSPGLTRHAEITNQDTGESVSAYKLTNTGVIRQICVDELPSG